MTDPVLVHRENGVLTVTLNRAEKRNAITADMYGTLEKAMKEALADDDVRVALLCADGEHFCAGNDLQDFGAKGAKAAAEGKSPAMHFIQTMLGFDKPLVAAVRGSAVGIGTTVLLHCDLVLASETARFALPFTRLGLVPEFGSSYILPMMAGRVMASHVLLTGETFDTQRAVQLGIVSEAVSDAELDSAAAQRARQLAELPPQALRATKRLINGEAHQERLGQAVAAERIAFGKGLMSAEHQEAVAAFFEKRKPDFSTTG
ncbi:MAG: enoyl-CoA hydratase [Ectothiorhodospiraceae bacterium]|nr:enoyl-CoA hydratase [Ectothiorhodospiraceae bacterium]MCH8504068.1 enoyl-CoA hydratase [Ectothiorhodospiraceae bacterium]